MSGPLGVLAGMRYDAVRNRYFPIAKDEPRIPVGNGRLQAVTFGEDQRKGKRTKLDERGQAEGGPSRRPKAPRRTVKILGCRGRER